MKSPLRTTSGIMILRAGQAGAVTNTATAQSDLTPQGLQLFDQATQDLRNVQAALTTAALADQIVAEFGSRMGLAPPGGPPGPPPPGGGAPGGGGAGGGGGAPAGGGATSAPIVLAAASLLDSVAVVFYPEIAGELPN